ncbi:sensor histidine kinase [Companilactobacillus alimentarius]|uniref:sensor histidine kinase n=1 Tax=Companilactobacillus alimentarius TaxID=1602 RepID=UPI0009F8BAB4|nr:GHKL domain-containing protein [Companilactobacillus alimentarius]
MVYIDWKLELVTNFFVLFAILQLKNYFIKDFNFKEIFTDITLSLIFGYIGLFVDDIFILFFVGLLLLLYWLFVKKDRLNMQKSIALIMAANIELVLFCLGSYTSRIIFFISNNKWQLKLLETYQEYFVTTSLLINITYLAILIIIIQHFRYQTINLWIQIEKYQLGKRVFALTFSIFISFMIILIISDLQAVTATIQASIILIFSILLIVAYYQLVFFVHTIAIQNEAREKVTYNKQLNEYLTSVQQQYTELRKFKHDFQNIMLAIKPLIDSSNSQELKNYYHDITQENKEMSTISQGNISQVSKIDSDLIRGLIIQKFFIAQSRKIDFHLELMRDNYQFKTDSLITVRILGILIDNALEYVDSFTTGDKRITCAITQNSQTTEITIDNPLKDDINLKNIFKSGYSTKISHSGFGLSNVRKLISQTDNLYLETKIIHEHLLMTLIIVGGD